MMENAYNDGYHAGYNGRTWFSCGYTGRLREKWFAGFDDGRNDRASYTASTMSDWRKDNPDPTHGCGHMQGRGAA
jgi:ribosome modulation factor